MNVEIAERLAARRREAGYSQEALAEKLGVTRQAVSKWERSESSPDTDNLIALARLYKVSLDELLNINAEIEDDIAFEAADRAGEKWDTDSATANGDTSFAQTGAADEPAAVTVETDRDYVHINLRDGIHVKDANTGDEVHVGWKGIDVRSRGQKFTRDWQKFSEEFDYRYEIDEAGRRVYRRQSNAWMRFPFPILALLVYILGGFFAPPLYLTSPVTDALAAPAPVSPWIYGLFLIATIPMYYMIVHAVIRRSPARLLQGLYPIACLVFFFWMWLILGIPHPTWVVFLTIPIFEWVCETIRRRSLGEADDPYDVKITIDPQE